MKKFLAVTMISLALGAASALASDTSLETWCHNFADNQGVPRTPCACIVAAIGDNPTLSAEMMSKTSIANYHETKSPALAAAVDPCVPPRRQ